DVIGANPPFMGKGNMSATVNRYCQDTFPNSFYDLCMVFVERIRQLLLRTGVAGIITQQTLLNLPAYDELRHDLLSSAFLRLVVQLGPGAFDEISGAKVNPILTVYGTTFAEDACTYFVRLGNSSAKAEDLGLACKDPMNAAVYRRPQRDFLRLPRCMVLF